ncbi:MAG: class I SAM-dependent methyltransferase [Spirochaetes bacterium]|nr:class I SAM-dependent methyltransferase [Spirochaetota bacterium]MBU0954490.1 class I SAM-dependent methyltransferase [Spirochaetota bacterium]
MHDESTEGAVPPELRSVQINFMLERLKASGLKPGSGVPVLKHGTAGCPEIIDLACGLGSHATALAAQGWRTLGVDINKPALHYASRSSKNSLARWQNSNLQDLLQQKKLFSGIPEASLSLVYMVYGTWGTLPPEARYSLAAHIARALRPGGIFILDAFRAGCATVDAKTDNTIVLLQTSRELTPLGSFWGLLPRMVTEEEWYYPDQHLFAEVYRLPLHTYITWKQAMDIESEIGNIQKACSGHLSLLSAHEGSFGLQLPAETLLPVASGENWFTLVLRRN